ncbi:MAG: 3-hexulose-6-phosphate synthase [Candidatus Njordarchaeia archaeon]
MTQKPKLQVAIDLTDLGKALKIAVIAAQNGAEIIEAGTPLIKYNGMLAVKALKSAVEDKMVLADLKTLDAGKVEAEMSFSNGADIISISALADDKTIEDSVEVAHSYGGLVCVDFLGVKDFSTRLREISRLKPDIFLIHVGLDQQARGASIEKAVSQFSQYVPEGKLAVAGGINPENIRAVLAFKPAIIIVGGAIYKSHDPGSAVRKLKAIIESHSLG